MSAEQIERQQVEQVFSLTGGELDDKPLTFSDGEGVTRSWRYHYDQFPEWAGEDFPDANEVGVTYFTLIEIGVSYESYAPEMMRFADGTTAFRVMQYTHSGECECTLGSCGDDETVGEDSTEGMAECPLCEVKAGEKHGYIYLGNSTETVYKQVDFSCEECGISQSEIKVWARTTPEGAVACDCLDEHE